MSDLFYPTIDLFSYDLRNGLGDSPEQIQQSIQNFKKKLPDYVRSQLLDSDNDFEENDYVHLLKQNYALFKPNYQEDLFEGYYFPVRLGDSYGLMLECAFSNLEKAQPADIFSKLKIQIQQRLQGQSPPTLGETWMISGWLPSSLAKSQEELARKCYKALMPDLNWDQDLEGKGQFLGANFFELSRDRIQNNQHIVIILYPAQETLNVSANFYTDWMRLFYYRHKILWAYGQSRTIKKSIKEYFNKIQSLSNLIQESIYKNQELKNIRDILAIIQDTLKKYNTNLINLDFQSGTIDINLSNYVKRLERLTQKAKTEGQAETNLQNLAEFSKRVSDKYLFQIKKDIENLERGLRFLENTIATVNSRLEVEKAERDRLFQRLVTVVGAGTASAALIDTEGKKCQAIFGKKDSDPSTQEPYYACNNPFIDNLVLPIALIISLGLLTWGLKRFLPWLWKKYVERFLSWFWKKYVDGQK